MLFGRWLHQLLMRDKLNGWRLVKHLLRTIFTRVLKWRFSRILSIIGIGASYEATVLSFAPRSCFGSIRRMNHRAWIRRLCVTVDIEAHINPARFLHHRILKHNISDMSGWLIGRQRKVTHCKHILTEFRKLWDLSFVGIMKFSGPLITLIRRPEALGGLLSADERAE